ncbi:MAG: hypothetical protein OXK73_15430 [Rhodospirillaceae bacterium]|nr:hypothetical protein [Rhodospirillaceae bacterium]
MAKSTTGRRFGYTRAMGKPEATSDDDDPAALARRFLDLWQEETAGTGRDKGPGALTLRLASLHLAQLAGGGEAGGLNAGAGAAAGAEAAAAPSGDGAQRLAELALRLAAFEERIAELAARGPGAGDGPPGGADTGRS